MKRLIHTLLLLGACALPAAAQTPRYDDDDDTLRYENEDENDVQLLLQQLQGNYLFHGTDPECENPALAPAGYYECQLQEVDGHLRMTGFIGYVDSEDSPYYTGTYDPAEGTINFICGPDVDGASVYDEDNYHYYLYDFSLQVGQDAEGHTTLSRPGIFWFYACQGRKWSRASYSSLTFSKDVPLPEWNGNIIHHNASPTTLDALLTYVLEFENAYKVAAAGRDIRGVIYDENGAPYAMATVNGSIDAFGSLKIRDSRAIISFVRIADIDPRLQPTAGTRTPTPGQATVVFEGKSFKIDGRLVNDKIVRVYDLAD